MTQTVPRPNRLSSPPPKRAVPRRLSHQDDVGAPSSPATTLRKSRPSAVQWQDVSLPRIGRLRALAWVPTILACALLVAIVYLLQTSGVATTGYDIQRLQNEKQTWQLQNDQLRLEIAKLHSLAWVKSEAVGRLGMYQPGAVEYVQPVNSAQH